MSAAVCEVCSPSVGAKVNPYAPLARIPRGEVRSFLINRKLHDIEPQSLPVCCDATAEAIQRFLSDASHENQQMLCESLLNIGGCLRKWVEKLDAPDDQGRRSQISEPLCKDIVVTALCFGSEIGCIEHKLAGLNISERCGESWAALIEALHLLEVGIPQIKSVPGKYEQLRGTHSLAGGF